MALPCGTRPLARPPLLGYWLCKRTISESAGWRAKFNRVPTCYVADLDKRRPQRRASPRREPSTALGKPSVSAAADDRFAQFEVVGLTSVGDEPLVGPSGRPAARACAFVQQRAWPSAAPTRRRGTSSSSELHVGSASCIARRKRASRDGRQPRLPFVRSGRQRGPGSRACLSRRATAFRGRPGPRHPCGRYGADEGSSATAWSACRCSAGNGCSIHFSR